MISALRDLLGSWPVLLTWACLVTLSLAVLLTDLARHNRQIKGLMRAVWVLTVLYSGPLGLAVYAFSGRRQIRTDSVWRRGWRSTGHCYSGCGAGEITGLLVTVGLLGLTGWPVSIVTFLFAYLFGYAMTAGPLIQEGMAVNQALWDAFASETASIVVMELVAIGVDQYLAPGATIGEPLFWGSMVFSLSCGLLAAWPVNVWLIHRGVKSGMQDPRSMPSPAPTD